MEMFPSLVCFSQRVSHRAPSQKVSAGTTLSYGPYGKRDLRFALGQGSSPKPEAAFQDPSWSKQRSLEFGLGAGGRG